MQLQSELLLNRENLVVSYYIGRFYCIALHPCRLVASISHNHALYQFYFTYFIVLVNGSSVSVVFLNVSKASCQA